MNIFNAVDFLLKNLHIFSNLCLIHSLSCENKETKKWTWKLTIITTQNGI